MAREGKAGGWTSQPGKKGLASTWQGVAGAVKAGGWTSQQGKKGLASTWQGVAGAVKAGGWTSQPSKKGLASTRQGEGWVVWGWWGGGAGQVNHSNRLTSTFREAAWAV